MAISSDFIVKNGLIVREGVDIASSVTVGSSAAIGTTLSVTEGATIDGLTVGTGGIASNAIFGSNALAANVSGTNNTAIGENALASVASGSSNVALGRNSGQLLTGSNNVILGNFSGNQDGLDISSLDGYVVIADGTGTPRVIVNPAGNVGIKTFDPQAELHVTGSAIISDNIQANSGDITTNLTVGGDLAITGDLRIGDTIFGEDFFIKSATLTLNADITEFESPTEDGGIIINRGSLTDSSILWIENGDYWTTGIDPNDSNKKAVFSARIECGTF